jgi:hypothetical protein
MSKKGNFFSKIFDSLELFNSVLDFDNNPAFFDVEKGSTKALTGTFSIKRKQFKDSDPEYDSLNIKNIKPGSIDHIDMIEAGKAPAKLKAVFKFNGLLKDLAGDNPIQVKLNDKSSLSLFGNFLGDFGPGFFGNKREIKKKNMTKYDYFYNGKHDDIINTENDSKDRQKLVELSVFPEIDTEFSSFMTKKTETFKGNFRISLDDNFMVFTATKYKTGKEESPLWYFVENGVQMAKDGVQMARAEFEPNFDILNPSFELLA